MKIKVTHACFGHGKRLLVYIMRTFIFLLCLSAFSLNSIDVISQNSKVTIDTDQEVTIDQVFRIISTQTNYKFIYQSDLFKDFPKVELKKGTIQTKDLLNKALSQGHFKFNLTSENTIAISALKAPQDNIISGKVIGDDGIPLAGVTIIIKGTNKGTSTDFDGNYNINTQTGSILVFSYLGFATQEVTVADSTTINITMEESSSQLDRVVIVGYGSVNKRDLTGSVASIKGEDLNVQPAALSFDQMLGGQLSGVSVAQTSSRPGANAVVNIRGASSISGLNQPLYVVDGIPIIVDEQVPGTFAGGGENRSSGAFFLTENPLLSINPNDIASVDVLKDASAAAIYGSRGANGVILITTKRGKTGLKPQLNVNYSSSFQSIANDIEFMNAEQYISYITTVAQNTLAFDDDNILAEVVLNNARQGVGTGTPYFGTGNTNWRDETTRSVAVNQNIGVNYSGGLENTSYFLSLNATEQEGLSKGNDLQNIALRLNLDSKLSDKFKVGTNLSYNRSNNELAGFSNSVSTPTFQPTFGVFNEDGSFTSILPPTGDLAASFINPVAQLEVINESQGTNFTGLVFGEYEILKGLKLKTSVNAVISNTDTRVYIPIVVAEALDDNPDDDNTPTALRINTSESRNAVWTNTLSYKKNLNEVHNVDAVLGYSIENREIEQIGVAASGFASDDLNSLGSARNIDNRFEDRQEGRLNSYFGRFNYNYDNRYFATFTARADGSTKFGANNRWGFFPSGALMWQISNEPFLQDNTTISTLKLRSTFGRTGLANLPEFQFAVAFQNIPGNLYNGGTRTGTNGIPNADLQWETTDQLDIALEFGLFNNSITGSVNYYNNQTSGLLLNSPTTITSGFDTQFQNVADISNEGWEIELGTNFNFGELQWISSFNIATNKNRLEALNGGSIDQFNSGESIREGSELGVIFGYEVEGFFESQEQIDALNAGAVDNEYQDPVAMNVGDYRLRDLNGDGTITEADRKRLGSIQPDFFGGWNNTLRYKGFELGINFQFVQGLEKVWGDHMIVNNLHILDSNRPVGLLDDTWTPENPNIRFELARFNNIDGNVRNNAREREDYLSAEVYDASYIRLRTLRLGYRLSNELLSKLPFERVQLNFTANNLFTITDWPGLDPESLNQTSAPFSAQNANDNRSFTVESRNAGALTRTFTFGINIGF